MRLEDLDDDNGAYGATNQNFGNTANAILE